MKKIIVAALVALPGIAMADEKLEDIRKVEKDGINMQVGGRNGYNVTVDGASFSPVSTLFVVDPNWTDRYYGYSDDRSRLADAQTTGSSSGAVGITYQLKSGRHASVAGGQTLEILPGRRLRVATDIRMTTPTPGILEHRIASITEGWLTNTSWTAEMADGTTTSGITPKWAPGTTPADSTLLKDFTRVTFESPRGPLKIETSASASLSLLDYRRNQWAEGKKYYWLGVLGSEMPETEPLRYEVVFTFPDVKEANAGTSRGSLQTTSHSVITAPAPVDRIIPTPKEIKWGKGISGDNLEFYVSFAHGGPDYEDGIRIISEFQQRFQQLYGIVLATGKNRQSLITMSSDVKGPMPAMLVAEPEGYALAVGENQVQVSSIITTAGLRNALRTLEQLVRPLDENSFGLRRATISDWPSLPFRGIHFFTGKDAKDLQVKMVNEILAPLKINSLVYQVDYVKWESQPQIHSDLLSMDKADAVAVGEAAERQGIDVIPLVNTFGHSEWLLQRPEMRYLADDPEDPYAYDPSNPKVYEIAEEIYREAIAMFDPGIMHIGHDEVHLDGFPKKPENKAIGATQLFINDTIHYYEFLKNLGIRTMMWGDMLIGPGEAPDATLAPSKEEGKRRRSKLPKDIIITDWHYKSAPVEEYKSPAIFNADGFDAIGCTWHSADNIVRFAKAMANQREETSKSLGLLQTTWAGYSFDEKSLIENIDQYSAYVLAAEAAWTGGYQDAKEVPFDYHEEFLRRWNGEQVSRGDQFGWTAMLDKAANQQLDPESLSLSQNAFDMLKTGYQALGKYGFNIPADSGKPAVVALAGAWDEDKASASILQLSADQFLSTKEMFIAMATPYWVPDGTRVGTLAVTMEDESIRELPLTYGKNALSVTDSRQTLVSPIAWRSENNELSEGGAAIHVLRWENPHPDKKVKSIELKSEKSGPGILVFGISGL